MGTKHEGVKIGILQIIIALGIMVGVGYTFHFKLIPSGVANFVVPLFEPSGDLREKIGFVNFSEEGLVFASVSLEKEKTLGPDAAGRKISKEWINGEYLFDYTREERKAKVHGYTKKANEFYVKAPALGEAAIILEPDIAFTIISFVIGLLFAVFITMVIPSSLGVMSAIYENQIEHTKTNIRLQTGFSADIVEILTIPDRKLDGLDRDKVESTYRYVWEKTITEAEKASDRRIMFDDIFDDETDLAYFRTEAIYNRIKEYFSQFVYTEVINTKAGRDWKRNKLQFWKGFRLYMVHHFTHQFANNVTGLAYGGAAVLIIAVGIRGLKFIPAAKPSLIMGAIFLEFSLLALLAVSLFYTEEEERTDKMLKRMEDANRAQLEALKEQQKDMHQLASALVGQSSDIIKKKVESTISEYLTSGDQVNKQIAESIAEKLVLDISKK